MGEKAYGYTLWRKRPHATLLGDRRVAAGSWFFDLADKEAVSGALDTLVSEHGRSGDTRGLYWLEITDPATGGHVRSVTPVETSLVPAVNGHSFSLENISDEVLVRELLRRLALR